MRTRTISALFLAAALSALSGAASAQDPETGEVEVSTTGRSTRSGSTVGLGIGQLRVYGGMDFGFGGNIRSKVGSRTVKDDLLATVGLQAGVEYVLHEYFTLGGELRLNWWNSDAFDTASVGRSLFTDLDIKPKGRYVVPGLPLEVYGTMPMGLTLAHINSDANNVDGSAGFNLGFGPGATYFVTERFGLNTEMLGVFHWFRIKNDTGFIKSDVKQRTGQFYLFLNAVYVL